MVQGIRHLTQILVTAVPLRVPGKKILLITVLDLVDILCMYLLDQVINTHFCEDVKQLVAGFRVLIEPLFGLSTMVENPIQMKKVQPLTVFWSHRPQSCKPSESRELQ